MEKLITSPIQAAPPLHKGWGGPKLKMAKGEDNKGGGHFVAEDSTPKAPGKALPDLRSHYKKQPSVKKKRKKSKAAPALNNLWLILN